MVIFVQGGQVVHEFLQVGVPAQLFQLAFDLDFKLLQLGGGEVEGSRLTEETDAVFLDVDVRRPLPDDVADLIRFRLLILPNSVKDEETERRG